MKVVADPNIAHVGEAFAEFGQIELIPGREITAAHVVDADLLVVRSVTRVDEALLAGSTVSWVGTATAGIDHIDKDYLTNRGISFVSAPGSNATSVAEFVLSAALVATQAQQRALAKCRVGIVGYGAVGSRVVTKLEALGVDCIVNDPPLAGKIERPLASLDAVLDADIVSVHVPLVAKGNWPTHGLLNETRLRRLRSDVILINAARGGVVDEVALLEHMRQLPDSQVVVDCWENEPDIDPELLAAASITTAHIAGYSYEGKLAATEVVHRAACDFFDYSGKWQVKATPKLQLNGRDLQQQVLCCYDVRDDSAALKSAIKLDAAARGRYFDQLRRNYRRRHEFGAYAIPAELDADAREQLLALGFASG